MTTRQVKGASFDVVVSWFDTWTGDEATSHIANVTGSTTNGYFKDRPGDSDANAVFTKVGSIVGDPTTGVVKVSVAAADTNAISQQLLYFELVTKLADGTYMRTGVCELYLDPNVGKTLF